MTEAGDRSWERDPDVIERFTSAASTGLLTVPVPEPAERPGDRPTWFRDTLAAAGSDLRTVPFVRGAGADELADGVRTAVESGRFDALGRWGRSKIHPSEIEDMEAEARSITLRTIALYRHGERSYAGPTPISYFPIRVSFNRWVAFKQRKAASVVVSRRAPTVPLPEDVDPPGMRPVSAASAADGAPPEGEVELTDDIELLHRFFVRARTAALSDQALDDELRTARTRPGRGGRAGADARVRAIQGAAFDVLRQEEAALRGFVDLRPATEVVRSSLRTQLLDLTDDVRNQQVNRQWPHVARIVATAIEEAATASAEPLPPGIDLLELRWWASEVHAAAEALADTVRPSTKVGVLPCESRIAWTKHLVARGRGDAGAVSSPLPQLPDLTAALELVDHGVEDATRARLAANESRGQQLDSISDAVADMQRWLAAELGGAR